MCTWVGVIIKREREIVIEINKKEIKRQEKRREKVSYRRDRVRYNSSL